MGWAEPRPGSARAAIAALAGLALAGTAATAVAAGDSTAATAAPPERPAWLVVPAPLPPSAIARAWDAVSGGDTPYPRDSHAPAPPAPRGYPAAPVPPFVELQAAPGEFAGQWRFHARRGDDPPHAAWRLTLPESPPYVVIAQLYCDDPNGGCEPLRRELAWLQAPRPDSAATMDQWLAIITAGPCESGPVRMPPPPFPPRALREEASGSVRVLVAHDACGQVRHASVYQSSRNRELDRAAVQAARRWRIAPPAESTGPGQAVVTVRFDIEDNYPPEG